MSRLLDEIAVIETLSEYYNLRTDVQKYALAEAISRVPSAQPEIIQCVDCRSRDKDGWCTGRGWPMQLVPADGFCDKGIRKEDVE